MQIVKLEGAENRSKWKWQIKMHFKQHDLSSIFEGSRVCLVAVTDDADGNKKVIEWRVITLIRRTHCMHVKSICSWFSDDL